MFHAATAFHQNLCKWTVDNTDNVGNFCDSGAFCGNCIWY
jgi:hypothetical protein